MAKMSGMKRDVKRHDKYVRSLQFQYADVNGTLVLSDRQGRNDGSKFDVVKLNYPTEYITCLLGLKDISGVRSITFGTNRGEHGPFGQFDHSFDEFCFRLGDDREFGGFFGTFESYTLSSIGVYLKPSTTTADEMAKEDLKINMGFGSNSDE